MRLARSLMTTPLLSIVFVGEVPIDVAKTVLDDLRAVAIRAGCPPERVRAAVQWRGAGQPATVEIRCSQPADDAGGP